VAIVGDAYIVVRALTDKVEGDIRRGFSGVEGAGRQAGEKMGEAFTRGFNRNAGTATVFGRFADGLRTMVPEAERARLAFAKLTRASFVLGPAISVLVGAISGVIGGLGALVGAAGGASASLVIIGNGFAAVRLGALAARIALGGVGRALSQLNSSAGAGGAIADNTRAIADAERALALVIENNRERLIDANNAVREAQLDLNEAFKEGREEIQQIGFEAEEAALSEQRAAVELQKAREVLARVQDLPPNSRVRKEAELAYQEAELNLRKAKDRSSDLNKEQDRLARTGVQGTSAVINATQRLAEAEAAKARVIRDAIRDQVNAEESLADAREGNAGGGGGANPFEGLNAAQIEFVRNLQALKPLLDEIKLAVSEAFLPPLFEAISLLAERAFPTIRDGMTQIAAATGQAAISIAESITEAENLADLQTIFASSARIIETLGRTLGNVWDAATSVLAAASPLAERFVRFLEQRSGVLADFLDTKQATGELEQFFDQAGDIMADFGEIFGNIFEGFGDIIEANFGPGTGGQYLLDWLITATDKFGVLDDTVTGKQGLKDYFLGAAVNAQKVLSSVGALIDELIDLGANPAIGQTFDKLAEGAPIIGDILTKLVEAGPKMADFILQFVELSDKFTDTESIDIFFETLTTALSAVNALLENEFLMNLLLVISQFAAFALALGTIYKTGMFVFQALIGSVALFAGGIDKSILTVANLKTSMVTLAKTGSTAGTALAGVGTKLVKGLGVLAIVGGVTAALGTMGSRGEIAAGQLGTINDALNKIDPEPIRNSFDGLFEGMSEPIWAANQGFTSAEKSMRMLTSATYDADRGFMAFGDAITLGVFNMSKDYKELDGVITAVSQNLGNMVNVNLLAASTNFNNLARETDGSEQSLLALLNKMPEYRDSLVLMAEKAGIAATDQNLLNLAQGEGVTSSRLISEQFASTAAASLDTSGKIQGLADKIRNFGTETSTAIGIEIQYEESLDRLTESIAQNGATLDITTEAGRSNMRALQDLATASNEAAAAAYEQDGDVAKLNATMAENRQQMIDTMIQAGFSEEAAKEYVDQLMMTPEDITTTVNTNNIPKSKGELEEIQRLAASKTSTITVDAKKGVGLKAFADKWAAGDIWGALTTRLWANGGFIKYFANGGMNAYANGGMNTGIYRGRPGGLYKFAEPETRWEAFISGKPGQEQRNIEIWKEAGRRLGVMTRENAMGNMYGSDTSSRIDSRSTTDTVSNTNINITVNPSPGMDERELASAISREISFQMRRGAVA
jgi:hypothetical protein